MPRFQAAHFRAEPAAARRAVRRSPASRAARWGSSRSPGCSHRAPHIVPIPGTTRLDHLEENVGATTRHVVAGHAGQVGRADQPHDGVGARGTLQPCRARSTRRSSARAYEHSRSHPGWLVYHPNPSTPAFKVPAGSVDAHCHVFGPGDEFPYAPERKYTPVRRLEASALRAARSSRLRQERHRAGHLPWHGQPRAGGRAARVERPRARRRHRRSQRHRRRAARAARGRRSRHALQLREAAGGLHAARGAQRDRASHRPARLACRHLLRSRRPSRAVGLLHVAAHDGRRRSHGPAGCHQAGRRTRVRALRAHDARAREHLVQGELSRAADA